jgi:hypothetical protein
MFQGMTIEELINSVERVEQKTREEQKATASDLHEYPLRRMEWKEMVEVA